MTMVRVMENKITVTSKSNFKTHALEYFRQIENTGQNFIITSHGEPKLEVSLIKEINPLNQLKGTVIKFSNPTDPIDEDSWDLA